MPTKGELIRSKAIEILKNNPQGLRYTQLVHVLSKEFSDTPVNTIHGSVWNLDQLKAGDVYKPERGLWRHVSHKETQVTLIKTAAERLSREVKEEDFYQPFANYLVKELEECTKAITLGGNIFRDKWGTPEVIGIEKSKPSDIIKQSEVIVSAEIKTDMSGQALITAFGQACAYKSFSHKVYITIPKNSAEEDRSRIESLCLLFGIGLVLLDSTDPQNPQFEIRVRPIKHEPDMFYVNKYLRIIADELLG